MPSQLYVPHIGTHKSDDGAPPRYIVQIRMPRKLNHGSDYVALSDFTLSRRTAEAWLQDARVAAAEYLRKWAKASIAS